MMIDRKHPECSKLLLGTWAYNFRKDWATDHLAYGYVIGACSVAQSCATLCDPMDYSPAKWLCPWSFQGKNTGVGCHILLQGIFPTQELNLGLPCFLHCKQILYPLSHGGSPKNPMNSMKRQKDMTMKHEAPRSAGFQYTTGEE